MRWCINLIKKKNEAGEASVHGVKYFLYQQCLPTCPWNSVARAKKDFHPLTLVSCTYHLAFSTGCLVLPHILDNKWLLSGLERILTFAGDF